MPHLRFSRKIPSSASLAALLVLLTTLPAAAQTPPAPADLKTHIANLASIDYPTRMNAARMVRRVTIAA